MKSKASHIPRLSGFDQGSMYFAGWNNASLILVGIIWGTAGITNPLIKQGTKVVQLRHEQRRPIGTSSALSEFLLHITTPAFIVPQLLNFAGSALFAQALGQSNLSVAVPLANGVSLAANAVVDHFLGEGVQLWPGIPGIFLITSGVALCAGNAF